MELAVPLWLFLLCLSSHFKMMNFCTKEYFSYNWILYSYPYYRLGEFGGIYREIETIIL